MKNEKSNHTWREEKQNLQSNRNLLTSHVEPKIIVLPLWAQERATSSPNFGRTLQVFGWFLSATVIFEWSEHWDHWFEWGRISTAVMLNAAETCDKEGNSYMRAKQSRWEVSDKAKYSRLAHLLFLFIREKPYCLTSINIKEKQCCYVTTEHTNYTYRHFLIILYLSA